MAGSQTRVQNKASESAGQSTQDGSGYLPAIKKIQCHVGAGLQVDASCVPTVWKCHGHIENRLQTRSASTGPSAVAAAASIRGLKTAIA